MITSTPLPAIQLYDGVLYRVLKKAFLHKPYLKEQLSINILSAKYGLISAEDLITSYDLLMTKELSNQNKSVYTASLLNLINKKEFDSIMVVMGQTYRNSIDWEQIPISYDFISGEIGIMQSKFKHWLHSL